MPLLNGFTLGGGLIRRNNIVSAITEALLVSINTPPANDVILQNLITGLGYNLTTVSHNNVSSADGNGKDVIVISSSVSSGNVTTTFRDATAGVVVLEGFLGDDMEMIPTPRSFTDDGILIIGGSHPIVGSLTGVIQTYVTPASTFWGNAREESGDAVVFGERQNLGGAEVMFAYEAGTTGENSFIFPGRRVFLGQGVEATPTADMQTILENSIAWAAGDL